MINRQSYLAAIMSLALGCVVTTANADGIFPEQALTNDELASLRGGFMLDNLEISIGLEQVVSVNGETLAINRLTIPNLNQMVSGQAIPHQMETVLGIISPGNSGQALISATAGDSGWMTLIQNNLDSTVIQNARQLNIELNNLGSGYRLPDVMREPVLQFLGQ
ncbi:hypothetical protein BKP64_17535 [Marinobacter salinus]|uniref:DUF4197 domain-containing protein n=1 Tax=Marinobacter salinus TaxID=1874317 RepID=A0A1D9GRW0_9GAMM|nr:hypothetical protein [Marinobacter salinus]AOY90358.1 hypothetical protein BKP64_17535 [Marinobacter salinus]